MKLRKRGQKIVTIYMPLVVINVGMWRRNDVLIIVTARSLKP